MCISHVFEFHKINTHAGDHLIFLKRALVVDRLLYIRYLCIILNFIIVLACHSCNFIDMPNIPQQMRFWIFLLLHIYIGDLNCCHRFVLNFVMCNTENHIIFFTLCLSTFYLAF
jgi:hypothetical protein